MIKYSWFGRILLVVGRMKYYLILYLLLAGKNLMGLNSVEVGEDSINGEPLGKQSYWYIGDEGINDVSSKDFERKFVKGKNSYHSFPSKNHSFWIRITFKNSFLTGKKIYLFDTSSHAELVQIYSGKTSIAKIGHENNLRDRVVEINLPPNSLTTVYIKKVNLAAQRQTWTFWEDNKKLLHEIRDSEQNWSLIISIFAMSLLFNVMLLFAYRSRVYLYYIGYLGATGIYTTLIWSIFPFPNVDLLASALAPLMSLTTILFTIDFLHLESGFPKSKNV